MSASEGGGEEEKEREGERKRGRGIADRYFRRRYQSLHTRRGERQEGTGGASDKVRGWTSNIMHPKSTDQDQEKASARERESERESARERERATKGERESEKGREGEQERERERARQGDGEIETERVLSVETLAQTHTYSRFQCANAYIFAYVFALSTCIHRPPVSWGGIGDTRYWRCR